MQPSHDGSGILGLALILFFAVFVLLLFVFWIWMLIDAIKNPGLSGTERIVWVLVIVFLHGLGATVYFFAGRQR
jgi:uncharacterized RDD family membrane protein YckC